MHRKPLISFLLFGLLLALILLLLRGVPADGEQDKRIVVSASDLMQLRAAHFRQWKREPTPAELRGLLQGWVREEVLYREALDRGLDENDRVVRRAMAQKMEFIGASQAQEEPPSAEDMEAYFALRKDRYRRPGWASFSHIYFSTDNGRAAEARQQALALKARLADRPPDELDLKAFGDPLMLPAQFSRADERSLRGQFGESFPAALLEQPVGRWTGPVESGYGLHLVFLNEKQPARMPAWQEVRGEILQDMEREAEEDAKELFYTEILRNYDVIYRGEALDFITEEHTE